VDPDERRTSTRATLLAAAGQNRCPPAGSYMAATGQDLMAADSRARARPSIEGGFGQRARSPGCPVWPSECPALH